MAKDLKDILGDDRAFESVLMQAMDKVGRERDGERINRMAAMSEDEFRAMLDATKNEKADGKRKVFALHGVWVRAAAACAVFALIIVGIGRYVDIGSTDTAGYASLFDTYYKGDEVDWKTFDAGDDRLNTAGAPSTAALLEIGAEQIAQKSRSSVRKGIRQLEHLLTLRYKRSLEHEIRWYLGLGYMKDNRVDEACAEFEKVAGMNSPHKKDAQELLEKLR